MRIKDHDSCPQLAGNTKRFETIVQPMLQELKAYAKTLPFLTQHFEEDWQDALIELWQHLHDCPPQMEREWAKQRIWHRLHLNYSERYRKKINLISCELDEKELCSPEEYTSKTEYSSESERLTNNVSCVRTAKILDCLRRQPEKDQNIVLMRLDNFTFPEIAKSMKLTKSNVIYRYRQTISLLKSAASQKFAAFHKH